MRVILSIVVFFLGMSVASSQVPEDYRPKKKKEPDTFEKVVPKPKIERRLPTEEELLRLALRKEWQAARAEDTRQTRALCVSWLEDEDKIEMAEARTCLGQLALDAARQEKVWKVDGQDFVSFTYAGDAAERAGEQIALAIHIDRSDALPFSMVMDLFARAYPERLMELLEGHIELFQGDYPHDAFADVGAYLIDTDQIELAENYVRTLEETYGLDDRVALGIARILSLRREDKEALLYFRRAVSQDPTKAINVYYLARQYDLMEHEAAERYYMRAVDMVSEDESLRQTKLGWLCDYAHFVENTLKDRDRACKTQSIACAEGDRPACPQEPEEN